ncbi:class I adenylate-forming enzyme family protein [Lysinibacillus sp. FSL P2-0066]|uniref:class I adenylate-forming enzyme family protein n=1 Tax=Lysinibacillus sp. FSL P2-0066 TaxID=2921720 RepID=UPI0030DD24A5
MSTTINNVSQLLQINSNKLSKREVIYDGYRRITYKELDEESSILAFNLIEMGVKKGDRIAICLPNWHEFVVISFAITKVGAVIVPLNINSKTELHYYLTNAEIKVAFIAKEFEKNNLWDNFHKYKQNNTLIKYLISVRFENKDSISYKELLNRKHSNEILLPKVCYNDDCVIMYTSGSTGLPKGVILTHGNLIHMCEVSIGLLDLTPEDTVLCPLPGYHIFGLHQCILVPIAAGAKIVLMEKYKPENVFQMIEKEVVTVHHAVPTMFILEINNSTLKDYNLDSLRIGITAGSKIPSNLICNIRKMLGFEVLSSYGMTETSTCLAQVRLNDSDEVKFNTMGKPVPGVRFRIIDINTRLDLGLGEIGEILVKSPGIMKGYLKMPNQTITMFTDDGWYITGDIGQIDEGGNIRITGRKKDLIIRGGYNINPTEIEDQFYTHNDILEVAVIGIDDIVLGEITCAAIRLKKGVYGKEIEFKNFIKDRLAEYKIPDKIVFLTNLPKTAVGKINKIELKNQLNNQLFKEIL